MKSEMTIENGIKKWRLPNGKMHWEDGPASESSFAKEWWVNGKEHREDGPAFETNAGAKFWFKNGRFHREDGPAIETSFGKEWWVDGIKYTEQEYKHRMRSKKLKTIGIWKVSVNGGTSFFKS